MKRLVSLASIILAASTARSALADQTPGLVQQKPGTGRCVKTDQGYMVPYTMKIPGTDVEFEMVPVPGGKFKMGSPESEDDRNDDEGPQITVQIEPFWMGKYEVTWAEYKEFMKLVDVFLDFKAYKMRLVTDENRADAITAPSNLYDPSMTFANGEDPRQPAATMIAFAAKQYTKYLSNLTCQFYRLPSEAEWEYACRAGSTTAFHFGDDPDELDDYGWYTDNSDETTQKVGQKKPNAWGLYDMHGNVAELVLDQYNEQWYEKLADKAIAKGKMIAWPTEAEPRAVRGGSWDDYPEDCRAACRRGTEGEDWKVEDPNEPKSPWWYTDEPSLCIGFRIVRPLRDATQAEKDKAWGAAVEEVLEAASFRISEGRGAWGLVDPSLPAAIKEVNKRKASEE